MRLINHSQFDGPSLIIRDLLVLRYIRDCIGAPGIEAIRNVETDMQLLDTGTHHFPVTINSGKESSENSYVVSPLAAYTGYARYELQLIENPWLRWTLRLLIDSIGTILEWAQIDRGVQVNNWLLSTNIYPSDWDGDDLPQITNLLTATYPDHAIGFRSINLFSNAVLFERFVSCGYIPIPSRQVYVFDGRDGVSSKFMAHHNTRIDAGLLDKTSYRVVDADELRDVDFLRMEQLYNKLYLDKYSPLNPQFSADWLRCGQRDGWLRLHVLQAPDGRIDGVVGWFGDDKILTAPIVGYDTSLPKKYGLYRLLTRMCLQEATKRRCVLNFSSGAAHFKRLRGGEPEIEYSMVYVRHLSAERRIVWQALSSLLHGIGLPIMRRLKL